LEGNLREAGNGKQETGSEEKGERNREGYDDGFQGLSPLEQEHTLLP